MLLAGSSQIDDDDLLAVKSVLGVSGLAVFEADDVLRVERQVPADRGLA